MRRPGRAWWALFLIAASAGFVRADEPRPASLARYFPSKDLIAYVEFDGIDAHAAAWKKTAASRLFDETATGAMLIDVATQILEAALEGGQPGLPKSEEIRAIVRECVRSGFAIAINRKPDDPSARPSCVGLVLRNVGRGPLVAVIEKSLKTMGMPGFAIASLDKSGGRKLSLVGPAEGPCVAWWAEKDDLVFSLVEARYADTMIAVLDGREPNAIEHPIRRQLAQPDQDFEPVGLAFLDTTALPELPPEAEMFGLDGIKRVDFRWGYQGEALVSVTRVVAPAPRKGVLAMFDQPTFDAKSLPPLPDGVGAFTAASIDLVKVYDQLAGLIKAANPQGPDLFAEAEKEFQKETGRRLRDDLLSRIGPRMVFADVPTQVTISSNPADGFARSLARVPRFSLLVELRNREEFLEDLEAVAKWANARFPIPVDSKSKKNKPLPMLIRRLKNVEIGYEIALSPTYWPLPSGYRPSIVIGERYAAIGTSPDVARQALRQDGKLAAPLDRAIASLPGDLTALSVVDTRNSALPEVLANVPSMIQWWGFAVQGGASSPFNPLGFSPPGFPAREIRTPPNALDLGEIVVTEVNIQVAPNATGQAPPVVPVPANGDLTPPAPANPDRAPARESTPTFFRLRLDPESIPTPDEIRPFLFPATYSLSSDASGFRFTTRESFPSWNPISLAPIAVASALPAFQEWRVAREKERESKNLGRVGMALNHFHNEKNRFPAASTFDKEGKPLLSWRVALLPALGQQRLFDEFHHDEPWDSPHNKPLLDRMPTEFVQPDAQAPPGMTFYRGLTGKGAFFDPERQDGVAIVDILDGTSNTMAIVEAKEAVPWTRPGTEIPFDAENVVSLLGGHKPGKFQVLIVDGSVKSLGDGLNLIVFRTLSTIAGGEVISGDSF